jgi:hypothetical protein
MSAPSDHALFLALTLALAIASPGAAQKTDIGSVEG